MQTTSFQGISPQFAASQASIASNARTVQPAVALHVADSVHFGGGDDDKVKKTAKAKAAQDATTTPERSFWQKTKDGLAGGFKDAFRFRNGGMLRDFGWGLVGGLVVAIIPPHAHILYTIPMMMLFGGIIRFATGAWDGFKGKAAN